MNKHTIFAAVSEENGILEFCGPALDLADAFAAYAKDAGVDLDAFDPEDGGAWYEVRPRARWREYSGDMAPELWDDFEEHRSAINRVYAGHGFDEATARAETPHASELYEDGLEILKADTEITLRTDRDRCNRSVLVIYPHGIGFRIATAAEVLDAARAGSLAAWLDQAITTRHPQTYPSQPAVAAAIIEIARAAGASFASRAVSP